MSIHFKVIYAHELKEGMTLAMPLGRPSRVVSISRIGRIWIHVTDCHGRVMTFAANQLVRTRVRINRVRSKDYYAQLEG